MLFEPSCGLKLIMKQVSQYYDIVQKSFFKLCNVHTIVNCNYIYFFLTKFLKINNIFTISHAHFIFTLKELDCFCIDHPSHLCVDLFFHLSKSSTLPFHVL